MIAVGKSLGGFFMGLSWTVASALFLILRTKKALLKNISVDKTVRVKGNRSYVDRLYCITNQQ